MYVVQQTIKALYSPCYGYVCTVKRTSAHMLLSWWAFIKRHTAQGAGGQKAKQRPQSATHEVQGAGRVAKCRVQSVVLTAIGRMGLNQHAEFRGQAARSKARKVYGAGCSVWSINFRMQGEECMVHGEE